MTFMKQIGTSTTLLTFPFVMLGTLRQRLVSKNLRDFSQTSCKLPRAPRGLLWVKWPPFPTIPNRDSHFELLTGNTIPAGMVVAISKNAQQLLGQVSTTPARATLGWFNQMVMV